MNLYKGEMFMNYEQLQEITSAQFGKVMAQLQEKNNGK